MSKMGASHAGVGDRSGIWRRRGLRWVDEADEKQGEARLESARSLRRPVNSYPSIRPFVRPRCVGSVNGCHKFGNDRFLPSGLPRLNGRKRGICCVCATGGEAMAGRFSNGVRRRWATRESRGAWRRERGRESVYYHYERAS